MKKNTKKEWKYLTTNVMEILNQVVECLYPPGATRKVLKNMGNRVKNEKNVESIFRKVSEATKKVGEYSET